MHKFPFGYALFAVGLCLQLFSSGTVHADVIVCFGDSLTAGGGGEPYTVPFQSMMRGDTVVNAGVFGEGSSAGASRFEGVMQAHNPKFVLIMEGTNDATVGYSTATVAYNLSRMLSTARRYGAQPIISTLTPRLDRAGVRIPAYNAEISRIASEQQVVLVDSYARTVGDWARLTTDGLHYNPEGAKVVAQGFAEAVNANRKKSGGGGGGGGGCFIATAAFGSYAEPHVMVLREFRDHILLPRKIGQWFVGQYYKYSPPVADFIADRPALKAAVRTSLLPVVGLAWLGLHHPALLFAGLLAMLALGAVTLRRLRRQTP